MNLKECDFMVSAAVISENLYEISGVSDPSLLQLKDIVNYRVILR